MENLKKVGRSTRNFVARHKVGTTVVITSAVWIMINRAAIKGHDEFLKEHDLYELFYDPER